MPSTEEKVRRGILFAKELARRESKEKDNMPYQKSGIDPWTYNDYDFGPRDKSELKSSNSSTNTDLANAEMSEFDRLMSVESGFVGTVQSTRAKVNVFATAAKALIKGMDLSEEMEEEEKKAMHPDDYLFLSRTEDEMLVWYPRNASQENGYQDNTVDHGSLPYFNVTDLLARFFISAHAYHGAIGNWRNHCIGITNCYFHGGKEYMPMFDYDGKNVKTQIRKDTKLLQKEFGLGDAWVYETRRGFHVYFFCDDVTRAKYMEMLMATGACKGFKRASSTRGYAVLRLSAKYTEFDIRFLYVLPAKKKEPRRLTRKAHIIMSILDLGEQCGTHFASLFPQWAHYQEDKKEWKPARRKGKRIRKMSTEKYNYWLAEKSDAKSASKPVLVNSKEVQELTFEDLDKPLKYRSSYSNTSATVASENACVETYDTLNYMNSSTSTTYNSGNND